MFAPHPAMVLHFWQEENKGEERQCFAIYLLMIFFCLTSALLASPSFKGAGKSGNMIVMTSVDHLGLVRCCPEQNQGSPVREDAWVLDSKRQWHMVGEEKGSDSINHTL